MQDLTMLVVACLVFGFCLSAMVMHALGLPRDAKLGTALTAMTTAAVAFLAGFVTWLVSEDLWNQAVLAVLAYGTAAVAGLVADPAKRRFGLVVSASGWVVLPLAAILVLRSI
jgi:hypothetical protein